MALTQPALSKDQWKATVTKMREVYKAPVVDKDVPAIIAYLIGLSARQPANASGAATAPVPPLAKDTSGGSGRHIRLDRYCQLSSCKTVPRRSQVIRAR
jgi:hypothetical protein